jgi:hypothetical protein
VIAAKAGETCCLGLPQNTYSIIDRLHKVSYRGSGGFNGRMQTA